MAVVGGVINYGSGWRESVINYGSVRGGRV